MHFFSLNKIIYILILITEITLVCIKKNTDLIIFFKLLSLFIRYIDIDIENHQFIIIFIT